MIRLAGDARRRTQNASVMVWHSGSVAGYVTGEENGYFFSGPSVAMDGKDGIDI